jgi:hypothetical protein
MREEVMRRTNEVRTMNEMMIDALPATMKNDAED